MTTTSVKQIFLQQLDNFLNELCDLFPESGDISLLREKYFLVKSANSKLVLEYFIQYIYPHKEKIFNKDESFFLEGGGQEELKDTSGLKFRDNIKNLWLEKLSDQNKEIIYKYFKVFIVLCEKYVLESLSK
jgi:hypothetical protein